MLQDTAEAQTRRSQWARPKTILLLRATEPVHIVMEARMARDTSLSCTAVEPAVLLRSTTATAAVLSPLAVESPLPTSQSTTRAKLCARPCLLGNTYAALPERFPIILQSQMQMEPVRLTQSKTTMTAVKSPLPKALQQTISKIGTPNRGAGQTVPIFRLVVSTNKTHI